MKRRINDLSRIAGEINAILLALAVGLACLDGSVFVLLEAQAIAAAVSESRPHEGEIHTPLPWSLGADAVLN